MPYHNAQTAWFASRMVFICYFLDSLMRWLNDFPWNEHDIPVTFLFQMMSALFLCFGFGFAFLLRPRESFLSKCKPHLTILFTQSPFFIKNNQSSVIQHLILYHLHQTTTLLIVPLLAHRAHIIKHQPLFLQHLLLVLSVLIAVATWNLVNFVNTLTSPMTDPKERELFLSGIFLIETGILLNVPYLDQLLSLPYHLQFLLLV